jgi:hypothetical protein
MLCGAVPSLASFSRNPHGGGIDMSRQVDSSPPMAKKPRPSPAQEGRRIIGFSLSSELASKVKAEAGQRQISLKKLFEEMWSLYEKHGGKKQS